MTEARAGAPAYLLIASGLLGLVYGVVYVIWTLIPIGLTFMVSVGTIMDGSNTVMGALTAFLFLAMIPLLQLVGFAVTTVMALVTAFGGLRLNSYQSKGIVWLAILCSTGAPLINLVVNAGSALNLSAMGMGCITGCLFGNIPTLVMLVIGLVASIMAAVHLFGEDAQAHYG